MLEINGVPQVFGGSEVIWPQSLVMPQVKHNSKIKTFLKSGAFASSSPPPDHF